MDPSTQPPGLAAYRVLLTHCPCPAVPPLWEFVGPGSDWRASVNNGPATLAALQQQFSLPELQAARLVHRAANGSARLAPGLCDPTGGIVALRGNAGAHPYALFTSAGYHSPTGNMLAEALIDHRIAAGVRETGLVFAPDVIADVGLLRQLDLPAILSPDWPSLPWDQLQFANESFRGPDYTPPVHPALVAADAAPESVPPAAVAAGQPTLVLLAWSIAALHREPSPEQLATIAFLIKLRRTLSWALPGIMVWRPSVACLDRIRLLADYEHAAGIRELLLESSAELEDIEDYALPEGVEAAPDLVTLEADLIARLRAGAGGRGMTGPIRAAEAAHRHAVVQQLTEPLRAWALAASDPVIRNLGVELADLEQLHHEIRPRMHAMLRCSSASSQEDARSRLRKEYLSIGRRITEIVATLRRWNKWA
ncbi:hypothetical protein AYO44_01450 [Planctomycetaceae bacterium SCGC AG-212-F19]|nr:hypothetical protein AYO44_01450 [Planctomycetaceae bacterium SCGC AG-212-F19]